VVPVGSRLVLLGLVTRDDEGKRSAAEEAGATLGYGWHS